MRSRVLKICLLHSPLVMYALHWEGAAQARKAASETQ